MTDYSILENSRLLSKIVDLPTICQDLNEHEEENIRSTVQFAKSIIDFSREHYVFSIYQEKNSIMKVFKIHNHTKDYSIIQS